MDLIEKIKAIIGRLEVIKKLSNPNIASLKEQIDAIENEEMLNLDEEFDEWINSLYDKGEPDEKTEKLIDKIGELFVQAYALIDTIREQFGLEDADDCNLEEELCRTLSNDEECDYCNDWDAEEYDIVLNEVSKSALKVIGSDNEDEQNIKLMGSILIGVSSEDSDDTIARRAFDQLVISGFILPINDIKEMCKEVREKCKKHLFLLQIAFNNIREYNCSGIDALSQIRLFL